MPLGLGTALVQGAPFVPFPHGLFSVVALRPEGDGRWQGGAEFEYVPCGEDLGALGAPSCDPQVPTLGLPKDFDHPGNGIGEASPFTVYGTFLCSPVGWSPGSAQDRATEVLTRSEERRVEQAFWTGDLGNTPNLVTGAVAVGTIALDAAVAVGLLEAWFAQYHGGQGVLHVPLLLVPLMIAEDALEVRNGRLVTKLGTPVVAGAGYPGTGPGGSAPPAGEAYIAITSQVFGYRSDVFTSSNRAGDLLDRGQNDLYAIAERTYLLGFDCEAGMAKVRTSLPGVNPGGGGGGPLVLTLGSIPSSPVPDGADVTVVLQTSVEALISPHLFYSINGGPTVDAGEMAQVSTLEWAFNADSSLTVPGDSVEVWAESWAAVSNHIVLEVV